MLTLEYITGSEREAELNMMQCVFTGLPRVGKSSFWQRVQGIIPERLLPSTDITGPEGSVRLDIRGSCGFAVQISEAGWRKIQAEEEMDGFLSLVTQQGVIPELDMSHKHLAIHPALAQKTVSGNQDAEIQTQEEEKKTPVDQNEKKQQTASAVETDSSETHEVPIDQDNSQIKHSEIDFAVPNEPASEEKSQDIQVMDLQLPSPSTVLKQNKYEACTSQHEN